MLGLYVLLAAAFVAAVGGCAYKITAGRFAAKDDRDALTSKDIGAPLGEKATLVQFSSSFCSPCRATRSVLIGVATTIEGIGYADIDAESQLDLVRRLGILRTPTVLVLDAEGHVVERASGQPRTADVIAALGRAVG